MNIIPAIDIINGKCVRLSQGDFNRVTVYDGDPLDVAKRFFDSGMKRLHLVDLDGARAGQVKNWKILERIAAKTGLEIDFSGGISSEENLRITFNSGAAFATIGSIAAKDPGAFSKWIITYGAARFILAADVKNEKIVTNGWTSTSSIDACDHIKKYSADGIAQFLCTDISKDGLMEGAAHGLYRKILDRVPGISLIASGGIGSMADLDAVKEAGCSSAIVGKAIYENRISLDDLKKYSS